MNNRYNSDANCITRSICIFSALYAPSVGGVETYTKNLANTLSNIGHRVTIVTMNTHDAKSIELQDGVRIIRIPSFNLLNGRYPLPKLNKNYYGAMNKLEHMNSDYVIVNTRFYPLSLIGLAFARRHNTIPILVEHGSAHLTMGNPIADKAIEAIEHSLTILGKLHHPAYYAVSRKSSMWLRHFGIRSLGELPNAIEVDSFIKEASNRDFRTELELSPETMIVASVSRLVPEKGVLQLAQAAKQLAGTNSSIHIVMAGSGPLEAQLSSIKTPNLHLVGRLSRPDTAALLAQANVYCLPSRSEGFATTLLEAAACRTPAITTNVGGVDELIPDKRYGKVIDDTSATTIANALLNAFANPKTLEEQGEMVLKRVREQCTWEKTASLVLHACEQAQQQ